MNRPQNPCEEDPEYDFDHCIEKQIVQRVGCQPYWNKHNIMGINICENGTMLKLYTSERNRMSYMSRKELIRESKCLMPCTYMEYKVNG